ncbi:MAG: glycosyltransferase family 4 protein [Candidatus Shapirobacteria bacterium]
MKAGIYDPYLDTLGGGERYCLTVAEILIKNGHEVDLFWSGDKNLLQKAQDRFSLNLEHLNIVSDIFGSSPRHLEFIEDQEIFNHPTKTITQKLLKRYQTLKDYDFFFYVSDGSIPFLFSKTNLLHFQVPFKESFKFHQKIINNLKSKFIRNVVCNSNFTARFIKQYFNHNLAVLYPPVDVDKFNPGQKRNVILSVGRFDNILNAKKQDILIKAFKKLSKKLPGWKLILAGGSQKDPQDNSFLKELIKLSQGFPIEIYVNPSFSDLKNLYSTAKIYWHAAGYAVNENLHPESTEHFGISVVEAMASGCVPFVVNKGGLPEIITDGTDGFLWHTPKELISKTQNVVNNHQLLSQLSQNAQAKSAIFSKKQFENKLLKIIL